MKRCSTLVMGALLLPAAAHAQKLSGPYVSLGTGLNFAGTTTSANETTRVRTDVGPLALIDLGWGFGQGLRAEIEGSYRSNAVSAIDTRRVNGTLQPLSNGNGTASTYAIMANLLYDIPLSSESFPIQPYVGAGVGYGWLDFAGANGNGLGRITAGQNNTYSGPTNVSFGSAGAFAYQAMVGAALPVRLVPGLSLTFEYRFFGMARADVPVTRTAVGTNTLFNGSVPSSATHNGFEEAQSAILVGLRYSFGGPG